LGAFTVFLKVELSAEQMDSSFQYVISLSAEQNHMTEYVSYGPFCPTNTIDVGCIRQPNHLGLSAGSDPVSLLYGPEDVGKAWHAMLVQLRAYKIKYGDCNVPARFNKNPKLGGVSSCPFLNAACFHL
jgi:hypothetical protein